MPRLKIAPCALLASLVVSTSVPGVAQTVRQSQPGFNLFSVQQDVEIGRQSAAQADRQLRLLNDPTTTAYLNRIVQRLAPFAPGARYSYTVKAVNAPEINAFAFPGGPLYINRGLIESARSEAELAGVLAHEMAHIALRHGTHQASKVQLSQTGLGLLGGLLGRPRGTTSQMLNAIGGIGLNAVYMKFSRDDEYQADRTGAQMMVRAGYDPLAMATMFELLSAQQGSNPGKVAQFFSSHPPASDRGVRIRQLATNLGGGQPQVFGGFDNLKSRLARLGPAPSQVVAETTVPAPTTSAGDPITVTVPAPSTRFARFSHANGFFTIDYPNNWRAYGSGYAVSIAPEGGVTTASNGRQTLQYGVIVNHYAPFEGESDRWSSSLQRSYTPFEDRTTQPRAYLEDATDDLVRTILRTNGHLQAEAGSAEPQIIDGEAGFLVRMWGRSPVTGQTERVTLYTRGLPDAHVIYAIAVAPEQDADALAPVFTRMVQSLRVNDASAHRVSTTTAIRPN